MDWYDLDRKLDYSKNCLPVTNRIQRRNTSATWMLYHYLIGLKIIFHNRCDFLIDKKIQPKLTCQIKDSYFRTSAPSTVLYNFFTKFYQSRASRGNFIKNQKELMEFAACNSIGEMKKTKSYSYEYLYERRVLENSKFRDDFEMDVFAISRDFKSHEELNNSFDLVRMRNNNGGSLSMLC